MNLLMIILSFQFKQELWQVWRAFCLYECFQRYVDLKKKYLWKYVNIDIFIEVPISHNNIKKILPLFPWDAPGKKLFYWISLNHTKILVFMFENPIYNNKENTNFAPPPCAPLAIFFWIYFD